MHRTLKPAALAIAIATSYAASAWADEGQWQPHQLPQLQKELTRIGIAIPASKLADLSKHPMSAMVSLGNCSASFVSNAGLVVTNHHCGYDAIQRNSTAENNLISKGFLAKTRAEELPGGPTQRVYVTDKVENVTDQVLKGLPANAGGKQRFTHVERRIKELIAECEGDKAYRCSIPAFHRGLEYYRIRQLMIRDVRLVYAPSDKIGNFGGEVDNFEWPRHTGDFSFLRAYVGKDGRPADYSTDNVPYHSKDFLVVSAQGLKNGDPILLAGYPGRTSRYKLPQEVRAAQSLGFPERIAESKADIAVIASATEGDAASAVRYASVVKGIQNGLKRSEGMLAGFIQRNIASIKDAQDKDFRTWFAKSGQKPELLQELDAVIASDMALGEEEFGFFNVATHSDLLRSARTMYRNAVEREKMDAERKPGYQERDLTFITARMKRLEQSLVPRVDQARFAAALQRYARLPAANHPAGLDALLPAQDALPAMYQQTELADTAKRLAWLKQDAAAFRQSSDPFVQLAVRLHDLGIVLEERRNEVDGNLERTIPQYMQAVIAWKKSQGKPIYADANSTLRVTYGTVAPFSPQDGLTKGPFTTVQGIVAKTTGQAPFESPEALLTAVREKRYGAFADPVLKSVPVNFLSSADTTGGNSGSAIMNRHGELIGLNFDSTFESISKDWYFDPVSTRAIHLDIRYLLWVMAEVDHADNVMREMTVKLPKR